MVDNSIVEYACLVSVHTVEQVRVGTDRVDFESVAFASQLDSAALVVVGYDIVVVVVAALAVLQLVAEDCSGIVAAVDCHTAFVVVAAVVADHCQN